MAENTEEINPRPLEEIEYSSDEVRVEIDGDLYAYRDGKWHIIVADGDAEKDQWTEKVAAVRTHVIRNERLWTIPSNWEPIVSAGSYYRYFSIGVRCRCENPKTKTHMVSPASGMRCGQ